MDKNADETKIYMLFLIYIVIILLTGSSILLSTILNPEAAAIPNVQKSTSFSITNMTNITGTSPVDEKGPTDVTGTNKWNVTISTDKNTYGPGDLVKVIGTLEDSLQGKTVRLDVYDPTGKAFQPTNASFATGPREEWSDPYPLLSDIQVKPDNKGLFSYRFPLANPLSGSFLKGNYEIEVTYDGVTRNTTFTVR